MPVHIQNKQFLLETPTECARTSHFHWLHFQFKFSRVLYTLGLWSLEPRNYLRNRELNRCLRLKLSKHSWIQNIDNWTWRCRVSRLRNAHSLRNWQINAVRLRQSWNKQHESTFLSPRAKWDVQSRRKQTDSPTNQPRCRYRSLQFRYHHSRMTKIFESPKSKQRFSSLLRR